MLHEEPQLAQLYYNSGTGRFREITHAAGDYFRTPRLGRSVACLDWNHDRALDLVVTYQEGNVSLLENQCQAGRRLMLQLTGVASNRDAAGARVRAQLGERMLHFHVARNGGYFAANDPHVLIGCGDAAQVDRLEVVWPSGAAASWSDVPVDATYHAIENEDRLLTRAD
jgi:hypothetical protein